MLCKRGFALRTAQFFLYLKQLHCLLRPPLECAFRTPDADRIRTDPVDDEPTKLCTLCAFGRSEADTEELFAVQREYLAKTFDAKIVTIVLPKIVDISSTELRAALKSGGGRDFLADAVYGYILREKLYGTDRDLRSLGLDDLRCVALSMLKPSRIPHVLGTEKTAAALAVRRPAASFV